MKNKMKKLRIVCVLTIALVALMLPGAVYAQQAPAQDPGPEWSIKIEYRYSKGEEGKLNIPNSITRYGRTYHLVSKADPVLESKLPSSRTYTWLVDGTISETEMHLLNGMDGVELRPTEVEIGRVTDKTHIMEGLPTNDVEALPLTKEFTEGVLERAAVRFDVEGLDDFDLPLSYKAEIIFRGLEIYLGPGYEVSATYTTTEDLDGVPVYVVVATYAPDGLAPVSGTASRGGGGAGGAGAGGDGPANIPTPAVIPPIDNEPDAPPAGLGESTAIQDDLIPQGAGTTGLGKPFVMQPWLIILLAFAGVLGGLAIWMMIARQRNIKEKEALREERRKAALRAQGLAEYDG